ncbi:MAG: DUF1989 domain-containing protein [Propionibacteriales bacterium]|nr:DUF1989 domain-containing protein [Propionibacteriales bacterium]
MEHGVAASTYQLDSEVSLADFPDHGCFDNLAAALAGHKIKPEDIPSPLNIFQHVAIDATTGAMRHTSVRPPSPARVQLKALIDCLVAVSACPDPLVGGKDVEVSVAAGS